MGGERSLEWSGDGEWPYQVTVILLGSFIIARCTCCTSAAAVASTCAIQPR